MTIPIRNLYYLFCYAWERFPEGGSTEVGIEDCPDLPNLFARVLINGVHRLMRRGLDRGYIPVGGELQSPRGRILMGRTISEQTKTRAALYCGFDELSRDILTNQILRATGDVLARHSELDPQLAHELRLISSRIFSEISEVRLAPGLFRGVQLFRNNAQYSMLMGLCEFVARSLLPEEAGVGSKFSGILEDEERMSQVFEDFLRNFYAYEQNTFTVAREDMRWRIETGSGGDPSLVPLMRTDVTLRSPESTIVIDAKFYAEPFPRSSGAPKIRSGHLYQLFSYMKHASGGSCATVRGALVYAAPSGGSLNRYRLDGHNIAIASIDLSQPWPTVHSNLMVLLEHLARPDAGP